MAGRRVVGGAGLVLLLYLFPAPLSAQYLDPGSSSIFLQVLLGGLVGLAAVTRLYWGKLSSLLHRQKKPAGNDQ